MNMISLRLTIKVSSITKNVHKIKNQIHFNSMKSFSLKIETLQCLWLNDHQMTKCQMCICKECKNEKKMVNCIESLRK